ncbi:MAG TPA: helix-turn-helix transcriptional regulator [Candidatus Dojkabacteria bacterium]|nr:helix-turn-helix transcriptional regulator [Candidatus Dojkabacteria bacterium]
MSKNNPPKILFALADATRYNLFVLLMEHAALFNPYENKPASLNCSSKLRLLTGLAKATVSYHLQVLKDADLIYSLRKGKFKYLFPKEAALKTLGSVGVDLLARYKGGRQKQNFAVLEFPVQENNSDSTKFFTKAMNFLTVHGYQKFGPTNFADNPASIKYNLLKRRQQSGLIEVVLSLKDKKIYLNRPAGDYPWIDKYLPEVKEKLQKFLALHR